MPLTGTIDKNGRFKPLWPRYDPEIIALGQAYVDRETGLPVAERLALPPLTLMQATLQEALQSVETATSNENQRAVSATDYTTALSAIKPLLDDALTQLKGKYSKNPAQLRDYGLDTKIGKRGDVLVARPTNDKGWIQFATHYVEQETLLLPNQRIVDPPLARITELTASITTNLQARNSGASQRSIGVENRSEAVSRLMDYLQLAAFALVALRFDRKVTNDLELWASKSWRNQHPSKPLHPINLPCLPPDR